MVEWVAWRRENVEVNRLRLTAVEDAVPIVRRQLPHSSASSISFSLAVVNVTVAIKMMSVMVVVVKERLQSRIASKFAETGKFR